MGVWSRLRAWVFSPPGPPLNVHLDDLDVLKNPSKPCTISGCGGTMEYHPARLACGGEEFPWLSSFVCDKDRTHAELLSLEEARAILREHSHREREAAKEKFRRIQQALTERASERAKSKRPLS